MAKALSERARLIRQVIHQYINQRLQQKIARLDVDDPKYQDEVDKHQPFNWLQGAVNKVEQIQIVTHPLKATYPDAHIKKTTSLYCHPENLPNHGLVSSGVLGAQFEDDATGNAAALDVYGLLLNQVDGETLLELCLQSDPDLQAALHDNESVAAEWMEALASTTQPRRKGPASHSFAKQLYWLAQNDSYADDHYVLLAPLYPSSLVHKVYEQIQHDRFSDAAKAAREARRLNQETDEVVRFYPNLAVQVIGGSKPQNISSLSRVRRGTNYLLASLPPSWQSKNVYPPYKVDSFFSVFERRKDTRYWLDALTDFLYEDPPANMHTRNRVQRLVEGLLDELHVFAHTYQQLTEAWSADERCLLPMAQRCWLNPLRALGDSEFAKQWLNSDWDRQVEEDFSRWLNQKLATKVQYLGDIEFRRWAREFRRSDYWAAQVNDVLMPTRKKLQEGRVYDA